MNVKPPPPAKCLVPACRNQAEIGGLCVACYRSFPRAIRQREGGEEERGPHPLPLSQKERGGSDPHPLPQREKGDPLARYAAIERQRRRLEGRLATLKKEARELETNILEDWADRGQRRAAVDGLCLFLRTESYCAKKPHVSGPDVARVLTRLGLGRLIGFNATGLQRYVKQRLAAAKRSRGIQNEDDIPEGIAPDALLPPELAAVINMGETVRLRSRLSKRI